MIYIKRFYLPVLAVVICFATLLPLFNPGFFPTQDFIYIARIYEMDRALGDGHFPVRWVPDFRYGEPLYNFYAPLVYYAAVGIKVLLSFVFINIGYLDVTKVVLGLGFILSFMTMFKFAKEIFGFFGGLVAATLYVYAPYHSVDVYVRGALSESWALVFFPLVFLYSYKMAVSGESKNWIYLAVSLAGLFYTHNVMTLLFGPFVAVWFLILVLCVRKRLFVAYLALSSILGFTLAASFLLPAFFEREFVHTENLNTGYFDFRGHFVTLRQFFEPFWGYGASLWGPKDDMPFQVGLVHWGISAIAGLVFGITLVNKFIRFRFLDIFSLKKVNGLLFLTVLFFVLAFGFSLFMMHNKSAFIWEKFSILSFTQFPWRFLGLSIFFISFLGGIVGGVFDKGILRIVPIGIVVVTIYYNFQYFHPESYYLDSKDSHYISKEVLSKDDKLPKDYLPSGVKVIRLERVEDPHFVNGQGEVKNINRETTEMRFKVSSEKGGVVEVPITYFPGWQVFVDRKPVPVLGPDEVGLVRFNIEPGNKDVRVLLADTLVRKIGDTLSVLSLLFIGIITMQNRLKQK